MSLSSENGFIFKKIDENKIEKRKSCERKWRASLIGNVLVCRVEDES
jgi:hypothetical protein